MNFYRAPLSPLLNQGIISHTLLSGFAPSPERGDVDVPQRIANGTARPFTDGAIDDVSLLIGDVREEAEGYLRGVPSPQPLSVTENQWYVHRGHDSRCDQFVFTDLTGKHVSIDSYRSTVAVGRSGKNATCYQRVYAENRMGQSRRVKTGGYFIAFRHQGVEALEDYLGLRRAAPFDVAVALANRIYFSGQYAPDELTGPVCSYDDTHGKGPDLIRKNDAWIVPPHLEGESANLFFAGWSDDLGSYFAVSVYVARDRCVINIGRRDVAGREPLMPLREALLPLWHGAMNLALSDPNDGGWLVRLL